MRIVKDAAERKNEILDVAESLFATKGFDNTSTNDILNVIGIARGTLYYHFKSKEEILDAVIDRMETSLLAKARVIAGNHDIPVLERITLTVMSLNVDNGVGVEIMNQVHKPQNALMHQKMRDSLIDGVVPIMSDLIKDGIKEGFFDTAYPVEAAEMLMIYSNIVFDDMMEQTQEELMQRIMGFIYHAERIVGAKEGSMQENMLRIFGGA